MSDTMQPIGKRRELQPQTDEQWHRHLAWINRPDEKAPKPKRARKRILSANRPPPLWMILAALVQQRIVIAVRRYWWKAILAAGAMTEVVTHVPHFR